MDKNRSEDSQASKRLDAPLTEKDPDEGTDDDTDIEHRATITEIAASVAPARSIERNEAVYGDTDMNPNAEDQRDEHGAGFDDIV